MVQCRLNQHALPITRTYMAEAEERLRASDQKRPRFKAVPAE